MGKASDFSYNGMFYDIFQDGYLERNYADCKEAKFKELSEYQPIGRMGKPEYVILSCLYVTHSMAGHVLFCWIRTARVEHVVAFESEFEC